jgi:hypothetical protein
VVVWVAAPATQNRSCWLGRSNVTPDLRSIVTHSPSGGASMTAVLLAWGRW